MKILVTGGLGYIGTLLTSRLLKDNNKVTIIDANWFGNYLPQELKKNKNLRLIQDSIINLYKYNLKNYDIFFHLANVANDPTSELDPKITWEINALQTKLCIEYSIKNNFKKFIFASSGSVYGVKKEKRVHEDLDLVPISDYNKTKMISERVLLSYKNYIDLKIIRPATVCGYSPKMRLDLSVNMLTMQALKNKKITVFGGNQVRPNLNINDMVSVYIHMIKTDSKHIIFNAGKENLKIIEIAQKIQSLVPCEVDILKVQDIRSYRLDSTRLLKTGFNFNYTVKDAILELISSYNNKLIKINKNLINIYAMKKNLKKIKMDL